ACGDLPPRPAERPGADPHRGGAHLRGTDGGRGGHGDGVQHPRHRAARGPVGTAAGLPGDPGGGPDRRGVLRPRQLAGGRALPRGRPTGEGLMAERVLAIPPSALARARPGAATLLLRMVRQRRVIGFGGVILLVMLGVAVAAPSLAPYDPLDIQAMERLRRPAATHPFGTDEFGRDILSRTIFGARLSLLVGGLVTVVAVRAGAPGPPAPPA